MATSIKEIGTHLSLNLNELQLVVLQPLATNPTSPTPILGQMYFNTGTKRIRTFNGVSWDEAGTSGATGDVTGPPSSINNQVVIFDSTTGKIIKASDLNATVLKSINGVLSEALADVDYLTPTGDGSGLTGITASQVGAPSGSGTSTGTNTGDDAPNSLYSSFVNGLEQFATFANFPGTGHEKTVYLALDTRFPYFWNTATSSYKKIGSFTGSLSVSLGGVKTWGRYANGATILATDKLPSEVIQMALVEPIAPTVNLNSSTTIGYNQTAISNVLTFSYTINSLGATVSTVLLERKRSNLSDIPANWTTLNTPPVTTATTSYTDSLTDSNFNNNEFNYRYTVTDSEGAIGIANLTINTATYVAPSISFSIGTTPRERGDITTNITGTITRNSPNVLLTSYQIYQSIDGGTYTAIGSAVSISGASASISVTDSNASLLNSNTIGYQIRVIDQQQTTTSSNSTITFYHKSTLGYSTTNFTSGTMTVSDIIGFGNSALTNNPDRSISNVTATAFEYTYYCYAKYVTGTSGTLNDNLTSIIMDGAAPVLGAFNHITSVSTISGTNSFGANVNYQVYKSNIPGAFTNNLLAINNNP